MREQWDRDLEETVRGDLAENRREDRQRGDRHLRVAVGHPPMEGERRHLDQEGEREDEEDPLLRAGRNQVLAQVAQHEAHVAAVRGEHPGGDRADEHQQRADERVDEELEHRRTALLRVHPPDQRQEVERHEHQVEEDDEERKVLRHEGAEDAALRETHQQRVEPGAFRGLVAQCRPERRAGEEHRRREQQHDVQPGDRKLVMDAERGDPSLVGDVLQAAGAAIVVRDDRDRVSERQQRAQQRNPAREPARDDQGDDAGGERQPEDDAQVDGHAARIRK
ncbi:unannotated protein [freshwater metagenome]|uniref:Unannotated protein n=1 Tax=freshwater metagenome TaxID=449393 RepID=A0A6J7EE03_9ZZZZ